MAKKKSSSQQPFLFQREIPQMPEGYYSSGPNPNLRKFVEEHAVPYDLEKDDYNNQVFVSAMTIDNRRDPINDLHTYWSKKPYKAIQQYIKHYTNPGDVVLDPFSGSGVSALAALLEGRAAIAIDISPAASFISKNYCTVFDPLKFQQEFVSLANQAAHELNWLYETRCDRCDGKAITGYVVYSYLFKCSRCLEKVALFDTITVESTTSSGKPKSINVCPLCFKSGTLEEIDTSSERFGPNPVQVNYICQEGCQPKRQNRFHNDVDNKKREYFEKYDLGKIREIDKKSIPYQYPLQRMMNVESDRKSWGDKWRAGTSNFRTVAELFTKRNLWALALILSAIENGNFEYCASFRFAFSGCILNGSTMYKHRETGGGPQVGTYYLPQVFREIPGWTVFEQKVLNLIRAAPMINEIPGIPAVCISTQSATELNAIPENSIDYIFTDPPYGGNVQYGELNFVWEAWLNFDTHWHEQEIIVNQTRGKDEANWAQLLSAAMKECYRVLKPGRWISLTYHDTSEGTWQIVQDIMTEAEFIPETSDRTLYIDTGQKSFNQLMAEKVAKRDLVINFRKPRPGELTRQLTLFGNEDISTFTQKSRTILTDALEKHPGSSADRLYDELVSRMVRKGEFERHNFMELLRSIAEEVVTPHAGGNGGSRWYLLETVGQVDEAESAKEDAAAARLERFMARFLDENPGEPGIHYSDLFEQYLPVADKPRRLLQEWLPEYFFKTEDGTWRPPRDDAERNQKQALRATGTLRRVKRYANALLEGVPPAQQDTPENPATAADWIRQCRRAGLYSLGRALYEKGGFDFSGLDEVGQLEVEEDYQICVRRS